MHPLTEKHDPARDPERQRRAGHARPPCRPGPHAGLGPAGLPGLAGPQGPVDRLRRPGARRRPGRRYEVVVDCSKAPVGASSCATSACPTRSTSRTDKVLCFAWWHGTSPGAGPVPAVLDTGSPFTTRGVRRDEDPEARLRAQGRRVDHQRGHLGGGRGLELHPGHRRPGLRVDRDLGAAEQERWLVPPDPHPPGRLPILTRNGQPPRPQERGPKDVVYLGENETVRLPTKFEHHRVATCCTPQRRARASSSVRDAGRPSPITTGGPGRCPRHRRRDAGSARAGGDRAGPGSADHCDHDPGHSAASMPATASAATWCAAVTPEPQ